jgi:cytochrome d ubiquinol oxidase subunit II
VVVAVIAGAVILFPSLALLFRLALSGRFRTDKLPAEQPRTSAPPATNVRLLARLAGAALIAGVGLLNVAETPWAHALGVSALIAFVILAFCAIVIPAAGDQVAAN